MNLRSLAEDLRSHPGISRKRTISDVLSFFPLISSPDVVAAYGEDAAVIAHGEESLLLATDGIMESLMRTNPYQAGYFAVLVNINDIAAMGGRPLAMVDVVSMRDERVCGQVMKGMEAAVRKFGVPIVGGHTHPDCAYNAIDVAILGIAPRDGVIYSHSARAGDDVIMAMDLDGRFPETIPYAWDTTTLKEPDVCRRQVAVMGEIGRLGLVSSGKDISNPGCVGTLGMLLETSGRGAVVDVGSIPRPQGVDLGQWLKAYMGCGFVLTAPPGNAPKIAELFASVGVTAAPVGKVDDGRAVKLRWDGEEETLFDFRKDVITGCGPDRRLGGTG